MINDGSEHTEEILEVITSANSGLLDCEYENNLFNAQDHTAVIEELKTMVKPAEGPSFMEKLAARFSKKPEEDTKVTATVPRKAVTIENIDAKQISYYAGPLSDRTDAISQMIKDIGANEVSFSRSAKLCGLGIVEDNKSLALKKAGAILLDAFDSGAEVFVVEDEAALALFQENFSEIEKVMGREIIGLELIGVEDFITQASAIEA